jgi:hypothetical protein
MRASRTYGSVRGAPSNGRPYRDVRQDKLIWSSRWKSGPGKASNRPVASVAWPVGDGGHEAYTAIMWGGILSRESFVVTEAEAVPCAEGNMCGAAMQGTHTPSWSKTPSRTKGTDRNLRDLVSDRAAFGLFGPLREGEEP